MAKRRRRRDPDKERFWRQTIRRQQKSELTVSTFCAAEGLKDCSFHWWRRELAKRSGKSRHEAETCAVVRVRATGARARPTARPRDHRDRGHFRPAGPHTGRV